MKTIYLFFYLFITASLLANDTVRVLFVYGSKPRAKGEPKYFGGIHGGHVSVQYKDASYASFIPKGSFHMVSKSRLHSKFIVESDDRFVFDTTESRYMIISIPVTPTQKRALDSIITKRLKRTSYDYAFLGMRCASAGYEILAAAGIFPAMSQRAMVRTYFYPKKLRKMMLKKAKAYHWPIVYRPGRTTRKWEKD